MLAVSFLFDVKQRKAQNQTFHKEFEVFDSITIEVNQEIITSILISDYGVKESGVLTLHNLTYIGNSMERLKASSGRFVDDKIYLDNNVTALQINGYYYQAEHAIYDKSLEFLYITSPFTAYINNSVIKGLGLVYDKKGKVTTAKKVNAVFYPKR
jgi:hypothetical protein